MVTKGGYLEGRVRVEPGRSYPDMVPLGRDFQHGLHPEFLADQMERSREALGLEVLDAYLVHNPEHYLGWARKDGMDLEAARMTYYDRLDRAMRFLESRAVEGAIRWWGLSSNTLALPWSEFEFTSLERLWDMAAAISPHHHFRVVQTPLNLLEPGAAIEKNQSGGLSVLEFAAKRGLTVLSGRPLNAIVGHRLIRLAEAEPVDSPPAESIRALIEAVTAAERRFTDALLPPLNLSEASSRRLARRADLGRALLEYWPGFQTLAQYQSIRNNIILPRLNDFLEYLVTIEAAGDHFTAWMRDYLDRLQAALQAIEDRYRAERAVRSQLIKQRAAALDSTWAAAGSLSRLALRAVRATPGVSSVLVGMRRPEYVADVLAEACLPVEAEGLSAAWPKLQALRESLSA